MTAGAFTVIAIFFGMLGCNCVVLMIWAKLMNPEQLNVWEEDDPDIMP